MFECHAIQVDDSGENTFSDQFAKTTRKFLEQQKRSTPSKIKNQLQPNIFCVI